MNDVLQKIEIPPRVIFLNIKDGNVFFDCSPVEARAAIDEIKRFRESKTTIPKIKERVEKMTLAVTSYKKKPFVLTGRMAGGFTICNLNSCFSMLEKENRVVNGLFVNAITFAEIRNWGRNIYDEASSYEKLETGVFGRIWNADIIVCNEIENMVFCLVSVTTRKDNCSCWEETEPKVLKLSFA